jgi:hypothetical protein
MAAYSETFPWPNSYGHYNYFEEQMKWHNKVSSLSKNGDGTYNLKRTQGDTLRVFICECYAFGIAEYMETFQKLGKLDAVIINSAWCGYSYQAKEHCRKAQVGLFKVGEFMGALNIKDYWNYITPEEKELLKKKKKP